MRPFSIEWAIEVLRALYKFLKIIREHTAASVDRGSEHPAFQFCTLLPPAQVLDADPGLGVFQQHRNDLLLGMALEVAPVGWTVSRIS